LGCGVSGLGRMLCWAGVLGVRGAARRCGCLVRLSSAVWWLGWVRCVRAWDGRAAGELSLRAGQPASHGVWSGAAVCLGACWDCLCGIEGCLAGVRASELRRKGARWSGCPGGSGVCAEAALSGARRVGCLFCDRQAMRGVLGGVGRNRGDWGSDGWAGCDARARAAGAAGARCCCVLCECGVLSIRKCSALVREAGVRACGVLDAWSFVFQLPG